MDWMYRPPGAVKYFPDQLEYRQRVQGFLNDCNKTDASQTTWILQIKYRYKDETPVIMRAAFKSDNLDSVEGYFLTWWATINDYQMLDPLKGTLEVELFTNYSPSETCAPRLTDWLKENKAVTKLTIYFSFVPTWDELERKVSRDEYVERLQMLKGSTKIVQILKINHFVLKNWAENIGVQFLDYRQDLQYKNQDLEKDVVTWPKSALSVQNPALQMNNYPNVEKFQDYVTRFLKNCNDSGAKKTIWIVRVTEFFGYENPVVKRAAFQNEGFIFVEENFGRWWETEYERTLDLDGGHTKVELYMNYTPTEICAPRLLSWLERNKNVTQLTIYFAFFYTWNSGRREVPKEEYVRRIEELRTSTDRNVKIGKVDRKILQTLAEEAAVRFTGYNNPWYSNQGFEIDIMTYPDLM